MKLRSSLALGLEYDKLINGYASQAAKMLKMVSLFSISQLIYHQVNGQAQVYNCSIEESAMRNAGGCNYGHTSNNERPGLGENIFAIRNPHFNKIEAAAMVHKRFAFIEWE
ncbi:hypothetical protein OESDEN_14355 [Oesophagostomum dentatum]|uniref:SCP domain-containing protein n=1 Tax=Oesophagostomum dentatum TaxID=61180 RepID=A0A0B1SKP6_OESDE|nr:hypothetical protein OESDEN_14355 [Oesophagostomum dentatum]